MSPIKDLRPTTFFWNRWVVWPLFLLYYFLFFCYSYQRINICETLRIEKYAAFDSLARLNNSCVFVVVVVVALSLLCSIFVFLSALFDSAFLSFALLFSSLLYPSIPYFLLFSAFFYSVLLYFVVIIVFVAFINQKQHPNSRLPTTSFFGFYFQRSSWYYLWVHYFLCFLKTLVFQKISKQRLIYKKILFINLLGI